MYDIDIRIFGVPERMDCIRKNQNILSLPDESVIIDWNHDGVIPTSKKAWLKTTDKPFVLVLQDDVELCCGFTSYCERIINIHPNEIISLFPTEFNNKRISTTRLHGGSPYVLANCVSGPGIIMKTEYVKPCLDSWSRDVRGDDVNIQLWAKRNGIQIITTIPSLIQHIGEVSVFDQSRSLGSTQFFCDDPADVDWESEYVTPWTNLVRRK